MNPRDDDTFDPAELERRFAELSDTAPSAREEALRQLAQSRPQLARRLSALLDAHARNAGMETLGTRARAALGLLEPADFAGRDVGGWRLTELLGRGGMGVVFGAERERDGVRQRAALKLLSAPLFDPDVAARFAREAQVLARLDHPGICRLRDFGHTPEGWPYLVLDRIDGAPLHRHAETRPVAERIELLARVADAVAAAHRQLVVHLDIKPENVLVTAAGDPVLLDFGIARVMGEQGEATATVARWLTPDYAAPERLRGEPSTVAADIHSLGALLYRVCCGEKPFELSGKPLPEALRLIEQGATPPTRRTPGLPRDLDAVVARAMHFDPARRYPSADAFAADLRALLAAQPVSARPDSLGYRLRKLLQRHPVAVPLGAFGVAAVAALAVALAIQARDLRAQRDLAQREAARARTVSELLIGSIKAADPTSDRNAAPSLNQLMEATSRRIRLELAGEPDLLAEGLVGIGNARVAMGQHALALSAYDEAIELMQRAGRGLHEQLEARLGRLDALRWSDRLDEAVAEASALLALTGPVERSRVLAALGQLQVRAGDPEGAQRSLEAAAQAALEGEGDHEHRADIFNSLGSMHSQRGQLQEAREHLDRALQQFEAASGGSPDLEANIRMNRAKVRAQLGEGEQALADMDRALDVRRRLFGEHHYLIVEALGFKAVVLIELGRYDEAIAAAQQAIEIERQLPGGGQSLLAAQQQHALGGALLRAEQWERTRETESRALALYLKHLPPGHAEVAAVRNNLAAAYSGLGDYRSALAEMLEVWAAYRAMSPDEPTVYLALIASNVADCHAKLGEGEAGAEWARRALELAAATLPPEHWFLGNMRSVHAANLLLQGQADAALEEAIAGEALFARAQASVPPNMIRENLELLARIFEARGEAASAAAYREKAAAMKAVAE
mgnify:CR=1 FL=1